MTDSKRENKQQQDNEKHSKKQKKHHTKHHRTSQSVGVLNSSIFPRSLVVVYMVKSSAALPPLLDILQRPDWNPLLFHLLGYEVLYLASCSRILHQFYTSASFRSILCQKYWVCSLCDALQAMPWTHSEIEAWSCPSHYVQRTRLGDVPGYCNGVQRYCSRGTAQFGAGLKNLCSSQEHLLLSICSMCERRAISRSPATSCDGRGCRGFLMALGYKPRPQVSAMPWRRINEWERLARDAAHSGGGSGPTRGYAPPMKKAKGPPQASIVDGRHTITSTGTPICASFNDGSCVANSKGTHICSADGRSVHVCNKCRSQWHSALVCNQEAKARAPWQPPARSGRKGGGKGKGKGKNDYRW